MPEKITRVAIIVIRSEEGLYFVHQRRADKRRHPGLYGLGAGGAIGSGEEPAQAAQRELAEETGFTEAPKPLFEFDFDEDGAVYRVFTYLLVTNQRPANCDAEWQWSGWLSEERVEQLMAQGKLCPDTAEFFSRYRDTEGR